MPTDKDFEIGGIWALGAGDPPATPIAETTYALSTLSEAQINAGWPFAVINSSAVFNEIMMRVTKALTLLESWGIMPWCSLTSYAVGAWCLGSNGYLYRAIQASTNKNPTTETAYWTNDAQAHADLTSPHSATSAATASRLLVRDAAGRAKVAAPLVDSDIALLSTVSDHAGLTSPHSATSLATANRILVRDSNGRAKVVAPSVGSDIALLSTVTDHANLSTAHNSTPSATAGRIIQRDDNGRAKVAAPSQDDDIARKDTVTAHSGALLQHGVYGGRVNSTGSPQRVPSGWNTTKNSTGLYTVTHNLGTVNYVVSITPFYNGSGWHVSSSIEEIAANYFKVRCHIGAEDVAFQFKDYPFCFVLVKT